MNVGVVPRLDPSSGGVYQYTRTTLEALSARPSRGDRHQFTIFHRYRDLPHLESLPSANFRLEFIYTSLASRATAWGKHAVGYGKLREILRSLVDSLRRPSRQGGPEEVRDRPELREKYAANDIDWLLYTTTDVRSFEAGVPYVLPIHDIQHRLQPGFKEVSAEGMFEWREYLYENAVGNATIVLVDSEVGKEDVLRFYGDEISSDRIEVLPFVPPPYLPDVPPGKDERTQVRANYGLPERYIFYPAQFWPHKNHRRIVEALDLLDERGYEIHAVFCGSNDGPHREETFQRTMETASSLGLTDRTHYLGFVPEEHMPALFAAAEALVMPTFFGPTNIPIYEAWAMNCPVITSEIRGIKQQVGDAGLLVDPERPASMADAIERIWTEPDVRKRLVGRGSKKMDEHSKSAFRQRVWEVVERASDLVRSGDAPCRAGTDWENDRRG